MNAQLKFVHFFKETPKLTYWTVNSIENDNFFNCLSKFSCKREVKKEINWWLHFSHRSHCGKYLPFPPRWIFVIKKGKKGEEEEISSLNTKLLLHTRYLHFFLLCALFDVFHEGKWTFAGGEVDLGIRSLLFFPSTLCKHIYV